MATYKELLAQGDELEQLSDDEWAQPDVDFERTPSNDVLPEAQKHHLCISDESAPWLESLIEPDERYGHSLRMLFLRITLAYLRRGVSSHSAVSRLLHLARIDEPARFLLHRSRDEIIATVQWILSAWEQEQGSRMVFPPTLQSNLKKLAELVGLDAVETEILGLVVLLHVEGVCEQAAGMLGTMQPAHAARALAVILGLPRSTIAHALRQQGALARSSLVSVDFNMQEGDLPRLLDLLGQSFAARMISETDSEILRGYVKQAPPGHLQAEHFSHIERLPVMEKVLAHAIEHRTTGVNILLWGPPGVGKTELARLLGRRLGATLIEIVTCNLEGEAVTPMRRLRCQQLAVEMGRLNGLHETAKGTVVLFDEAEEVLDTRMHLFSDDEVTARKSFLNAVLESNSIPCIWIANNVSELEASYIRRFSLVVEILLPPSFKRHELMHGDGRLPVDPRSLDRIARHPAAVPALLEQTSRILNVVGSAMSEQERGRLAIGLLNDHLAATGVPPIALDAAPTLSFKPELLNCSIDLQALHRGLAGTRQGRLLFTGPPGTGKTSLGRWLADSLGMPQMCVKASELLGTYVGETERAIANAFRQARAARAVLQIDEVDSFLSSRHSGQQQWELSLVNEILQQMEAFQGVFVASTNLESLIDPAAMRRFDMTLNIDFLKPSASIAMLRELCQLLGVGEPSAEQECAIGKQPLLAPGDYHQVLRQHTFLPATSVAEVIARLTEAVRLKRSKLNPGGIGFLRLAA